MSRTDIVAPSLIDPAAYTFRSGVYFGNNEAFMEYIADFGIEDWEDNNRAEVRRQLRPDLLLAEGNFSRKGTCDHCGARFDFGSVYTHASGKLIVVGNTCAENTLGVPDRLTLEINRAKKAAAAAKAAKAAAAAALVQAEAQGFAWLYNEPNHTDRILIDIAAKGRKYGGLTPAQVELVKRIFSGEPAQWQVEKAARDAARAAEDAAKVPVIEGRHVITGVVKAVKMVPSMGPYGRDREVKKLIVRDDRGFTVWVSCPASIHAAERGDRVTLTATVTKGDRDPSFGFGKRPTNAQVLQAVAS